MAGMKRLFIGGDKDGGCDLIREADYHKEAKALKHELYTQHVLWTQAKPEGGAVYVIAVKEGIDIGDAMDEVFASYSQLSGGNLRFNDEWRNH